jgi:hypothetical protein
MIGFGPRWLEKGKVLLVSKPAYSEDDADLEGDAVYELTPDDPEFEELAKLADAREEEDGNSDETVDA